MAHLRVSENEHESVPFYRYSLICGSESGDKDDKSDREQSGADFMERVIDGEKSHAWQRRSQPKVRSSYSHATAGRKDDLRCRKQRLGDCQNLGTGAFQPGVGEGDIQLPCLAPPALGGPCTTRLQLRHGNAAADTAFSPFTISGGQSATHLVLRAANLYMQIWRQVRSSRSQCESATHPTCSLSKLKVKMAGPGHWCSVAVVTLHLQRSLCFVAYVT